MEPSEIYHLSALRVRAALGRRDIPSHARKFAERMVHASGDVSIANNIRVSEGLTQSVSSAIANGGGVLCDTEMLRAGIMSRFIEESRVMVMKAERATNSETRAALGVASVGRKLSGEVVVIGSNPTALARLIDGIEFENWEPPEAIIATPVGFVGASAVKRRLDRINLGVPYLTLLGRRGGAGLAAAAVNACFIERLEQQ